MISQKAALRFVKNNAMPSSKKPAPCLICKNPVVPQFQPFCSERCKMIDLGHWLKGTYVIPSTEDPTDSEDLKEDDPNSELETE